MDNPGTESALDVNSAAAAFGSLLEPQEQQQEKPEEEAKPEPVKAEETTTEGEPKADETATEEPQKFTVKVDGQELEVTLDELKNGYQRQSDYTRKTMEVSETRKAAEAETAKARQERQEYAQKLSQQMVVLEAAIKADNETDWNQLIESNPVEALKQIDLREKRQRAFQQAQQEAVRVAQLEQAERQNEHGRYLQQQQERLLAKLPEWKDAEKSKAERTALREFLQKSEFTPQETNAVDNSAALLVNMRKAMLYDQMVASAKAAAKKVEAVPKRVESVGSGNAPVLDKRSAAFQKLSKTGRVEDAADIFKTFV